MKWVVGGCAVIFVASFVFVYTVVNTLCDGDYWPDW